jgi:mono/diheme cytochrome c family protein
MPPAPISGSFPAMPCLLRRSARLCRWFVGAGCVLISGAAVAADPAPAAPDARQLERGRRIYRQLCAACHMPDGRGVPTATPPLDRPNSPLRDREGAIRIVLDGWASSQTEGENLFVTPMPPLGQVLTDQAVADVLTFVFQRWGAPGEPFDPGKIAATRADAQ